MNIRSVQEIGECKGKHVVVRVDFNVPIQNDQVVDDLRIKKSLKTINFLREKGARTVLISHIENKIGENISLAPVAQYLEKLFPIIFGKAVLGTETASAISAMKDGDVMLLENLRTEAGEKENDAEFAKKLARYGEFYVNDAFSVSHRAHASVVALPAFLPHFAGFNLLDEIKNLSQVFSAPHPFFFILGGAKFETKMPLIQKFMKLANHVFVGGALANNFFKEKGLATGKSLVSSGNFGLKQYFNDPKLMLPVDVVVKDAETFEISVKNDYEVGENDIIMDIGPISLLNIKTVMMQSKFVLWNGPMGNYEEGFKDQTIGIAKIIAETKVKAAIGGGDTTAAVASLDLDDDSNLFVSTGGGAMLQYLLDETLPGIDALK